MKYIKGANAAIETFRHEWVRTPHSCLMHTMQQ